MSDDLRVQCVDHPGGARSYLVLDIASGRVHGRADRFLARHGEDTQRTYAHHLVDHLRWLRASGHREERISVEDLRRYPALCGTRQAGPQTDPQLQQVVVSCNGAPGQVGESARYCSTVAILITSRCGSPFTGMKWWCR